MRRIIYSGPLSNMIYAMCEPKWPILYPLRIYRNRLPNFSVGAGPGPARRTRLRVIVLLDINRLNRAGCLCNAGGNLFAVSTNGKNGGGRGEQDPANQLIQLREWCTRCGHEIVGKYIDRVFGKGADGLNFLECSRTRTSDNST